MKNTRRIYQSKELSPNPETSIALINDLEGTIQSDTHLPHRSMCKCLLCTDETFDPKSNLGSLKLKSTALEGAKSMKKIFDGLIISGVKSLKLYLPDLFFIEQDSLEIFQTSKEGRIAKIPGATPLKHLYPMLVRLRREYKSNLQQNFNRQILQKLQTYVMHEKYYEKIVPSSFHAGLNSALLDSNKSKFKLYTLHKNKNYQIQSLEQHKMNEKQPFCLMMYRDGNCQLLNQVQFQLFTIQNQLKMAEEVMFVQSYIKYKKQTKSIIFSEYTYDISSINVELDTKAQQDVMNLLGALEQFDEGYNDLQSIEQIDLEIMQNNPKKYTEIMTYKIVHYLAMASRIYISRIKIKWIVNDIGAVYLQEIMECVMSQVPRRIIKFRLPRQDESLNFYRDSGHFLDIYKDMKRRRALNTLIIKKQIDSKTYDELMEILNPDLISQNQTQKHQPGANKKTIKSQKTKDHSRLYQTIDVKTSGNNLPIFTHPRKSKVRNNSSTYEQHLKEHPELAMRNLRYGSVNINRYSPEKSERVDTKINNHFLYNMSTQDKKILLNHNPNPRVARSSLQHYIQQKKNKIASSVLYSTFSDLSYKKMKEINNLLQHEKISQKLQENSSKEISPY